MPITEVGQWQVSYMQILDDEGNADPELEPTIGEDDLKKLYYFMVLARELDQRKINLQRQGRIGTFGPSTGQEAVHCTAAFVLRNTDWFVGAFREAGARLIRGESPGQALLVYNGLEEGGMHPKGAEGRTLPISIIVAAQTLHAVGIAYALKYRKTDSVALTIFGDGATSQGDLHEAMNNAAAWQVPVIFLCQNNQWAISTPRSKQTHSKTLAQKAIAYDIPTIQIDGNDVLAVYKAVTEAIDRARRGEGPSMIEAVTYRLMMHTTADDPTRYRTDDDVTEAWKHEPIPKFRKYLEKKGCWNEEQQTQLEAKVKEEIDAAVAHFEEITTQFKPDAQFDNVYGTTHPLIEEQRAEFLDNLSKEAAGG